MRMTPANDGGAVDVLAVLRRHLALAKEVASADQVAEAREVLAAVADLIKAAEGAEAFIGVMFGSISGRVPEAVDTPLGISVKLGAIAKDLSAAISRATGAKS